MKKILMILLLSGVLFANQEQEINATTIKMYLGNNNNSHTLIQIACINGYEWIRSSNGQMTQVYIQGTGNYPIPQPKICDKK